MPLMDTSPFAVIRSPAATDPNTKFPLDGRDVLKRSQSELIEATASAPPLHDLQGNKIVRVSTELVVKRSRYSLPCEAEAMRLVARKTSILIPKVYRSFTVYGTNGRFDSTGYIVMDYVQGTCLGDCWNELSPGKRQSVAQQVASYICQLQSLHITQPGPIGGGPSQGNWFSVYASGPFQTAADMEEWFNTRLDIAKRTSNAPEDELPFNFDTFVMSHLDISPRNLILDARSQVWLIDWTFAGAYPPIFEIGALNRQTEAPDFNSLVLERVQYNKDALRQLMYIRDVLHFISSDELEQVEKWAMEQEAKAHEQDELDTGTVES